MYEICDMYDHFGSAAELFSIHFFDAFKVPASLPLFDSLLFFWLENKSLREIC